MSEGQSCVAEIYSCLAWTFQSASLSSKFEKGGLPVAPRTNMCSGMMTTWILGEKYEGGLMERIYKFQGTVFIKL